MEDLISSDPIKPLLQPIRHELVNRIWLGMFLVSLVGAPTSLSRAVFTGWLPIYYFHIFVLVATTAIYLLRHRLSFSLKAALALFIFYIFGAISLFTLGLLGAGFWWLLFSSLLATIIYSPQLGAFISLSALSIVSLAGYAFVTGRIVIPFDANKYLQNPTSWISFGSVVLMMPLVIFQPVVVFQKSTIKLLKEVECQRAEIERLANHDRLTGLPSLNLATDRLEMALHSARRWQKKVALMFIDLDGFKEINDTYGHEAGDQVLIETSKRLVNLLRHEDTAARIGGDEFIAIVGDLESEDYAGLLAQRIIRDISQPINFLDNSVSVGASIGIAIFPDHARDAQSLRRSADEAMYSVKRVGKNNFGFAISRIERLA